MVKYRRIYIPGGIYFFTVVLQDRHLDYLTKYINELTAALRHVRQMYPFKTHAMVVLPEHLHVMWEMPIVDSDFSLRWRFIKTQFAKKLKKIGIPVMKNRFGEHVLWQRRFWEHVIRDENDYAKHIDYIHYNPVKHNLVDHPKDWPYSTFHQYVKRGLLPTNWCYQNEDIHNAE